MQIEDERDDEADEAHQEDAGAGHHGHALEISETRAARHLHHADQFPELFGYERLKTGETNWKTGKGLHTTSNSVMLLLPGGGYIIDTPGIREFNLSDITRDNLRFYFIEFLAFMPDCAFSSCTHTVEPECAILGAVESGHIDSDRYESYLAIYESIDRDS